jgi:hypothetical protein
LRSCDRANHEMYKRGAVAQLGEHLVCNQEVTGSRPVSSTILK